MIELKKNRLAEVDEVYVGGKIRGEGQGFYHKAFMANAVEVRTKVVKSSRQTIQVGSRLPSIEAQKLLYRSSPNVLSRKAYLD